MRTRICPQCGVYPRRRDQDGEIWIECRTCDLKTGKISLMSDTAYLRTLEAWNLKTLSTPQKPEENR
jgi:ribosomal protein L37AE/L43A